MRPIFFPAPPDLRKWFEANHSTAAELWLGFYKKGSGMPSVTWPESVDEALCVGWIDGVRRSLDGARYVIRFTPRRALSIWSAINVRRAQALARERRMRPAGLAAFAARRSNRVGVYSYEKRPSTLPAPYHGLLRKNPKACAFFEAQPGSYKRAATWWVLSAKREETRAKRLKRLIALSARGRRIPQFARRHASK